jgi:hypothetical protein
MEVRGSGPNRRRALEALRLTLVFPALAEGILNDFELKAGEALTPPKRDALWKLARSDEAVKSASPAGV